MLVAHPTKIASLPRQRQRRLLAGSGDRLREELHPEV